MKKVKNKEYYSIGEVSDICNVSKKAMRFYDEIGLISPDKVGSNNYRYYSRESLLNLTILKYYKQMGFRLEEMRSLLESEEYQVIEHGFLNKIEELKDEARSIETKLTSIGDWYSLLLEAQTVINNDVRDVSVKYVEPQQFGYMDQPFDSNSKESIINLDWADYLVKIGNEITGPVNIMFPSYKGRIEGNCECMRILQKMIMPASEQEVMQVGGCMMASCYHIGSHSTLPETYAKMEKWASEHQYKIGPQCWERYVTDYWTTRNEDMFVTEILMEIKR